MRELTNEEIERFASRKGVRRIAVENFLMSMGTELRPWQVRANANMDARLYRWNYATVKAINDGIDLALRG